MSDDDARLLVTILKKVTLAEGSSATGKWSEKIWFCSSFPVHYRVFVYESRRSSQKRKGHRKGEHRYERHVKFVIVDGASILQVTEAAKDDWDQGRAQLLMEMFTAHHNNVRGGFPDDHEVLEPCQQGIYGNLCRVVDLLKAKLWSGRGTENLLQ